MKRIAHYRPSGAMVVAVVAAVIASAGSATAASLITSGQIKNNTIRSGDIRNNTIRSKDVRNHTLLRRDFKPGVLVPGPPGATGAPGHNGTNGTNGFGRLAYPIELGVVAAGDTKDVEAVCPAGTFPTGGAARAVDHATGTDVASQVIQSQFFPSGEDGPEGFEVSFKNTTGGPVDLELRAACANANQVNAP